MQRRSSLVSWISLVAILVSLFTPLFELDTSAQDELPDPEVSLASDGATPEPDDPVEEMTLEPIAEPTVAPTLEPTSEPTAEPTQKPTEVPTSEPTAVP